MVDGENRLLGVVNLEEAHLASQLPSLTPLVLAEDLMRTGIRPLTPDDTLDRALELFVENDLLILPVVDDLRERRVIGMVRRFEIASAYVRRLHAATRSRGRRDMSERDLGDYEPGVLRVFQTKGETKAFYNKIAKVYDLLSEHSEQRHARGGDQTARPCSGRTTAGNRLRNRARPRASLPRRSGQRVRS